MRRKVMMAFSLDSEWGFCFLCLPIAWKIEDKLRDIKFQAEGGKRDVGVYCKQLLPSALHVVVHMRSKARKKKKPHHIHRWLHNPRQMSEGLAWQLEHLWKRTQRSEHDGFTDGCMCGEMMESPSQMSLYHLIFRDIKSNNLKQPQMMHSHLVRMFMFVVITYRQIQNKHLPLWD